MTAGGAHLIVFANEKGGTGKSTAAIHAATALCRAGYRVAALDLDSRQRSLARFFENRAQLALDRQIQLPSPSCQTFRVNGISVVDQLDALGRDAEIVIVDTPGRDDINALAAIARAETLVTPINDSFVDLDLIGTVDPRTMQLSRPSFYARLIWDTRRQRRDRGAPDLDWIVLRNRLQHIQAGNTKRVGAVLDELASRVGFRLAPGLTERVVYRELFPQGLTVLDLDLSRLATAARYRGALAELDALISSLRLSTPAMMKAHTATAAG